MKILRTLLLFAILAFALSALFFFMTDGTITATWQSKLGEIATIAVIIFIVLLIIYAISRTVIKSATAITKKRPPKPGAPQV